MKLETISISFREKIIQIEITVNEIDSDVHKKINPIYLKKLDKIEKEDKKVHLGIEDWISTSVYEYTFTNYRIDRTSKIDKKLKRRIEFC